MEKGGFQIRLQDTDEGVRVMELVGELDLAEADHVRREIIGSDGVERLVVDTTELSFIDSSGLSALVAGVNELGSARFQLIPGRATERLLQITGTNELFGI